MPPKKEEPAPPAAPKKRNSKKNGDAPDLNRDRDIERVKVEKEVLVPMSEEEFRRDSMKLAAAEVKLAQLKSDNRKVNEKFRAEKREQEKIIEPLSKAIDTKKTMRTVFVTEERIYSTMTIRWIDDKGTVIDEKAMPKEMLQRTIFDQAPSGSAVEAEEEEDDDDAAE